MIIHPEPQGSVEWLLKRAGLPTASEFDQLVTPDFKIRTGETPRTYLAKKVSERWQGGPLVEFNTFDMEQGNILENEAKPWYALEYNQEIQSVGLITTDDGRIGCSPDGLIGADSGIEIKCPQVYTHVRYLLNGGLPKEYAAQVHGSMFVTGRSEWKFVSYRRRFPALVLTVERDEKIQSVIRDALEVFLSSLDLAWKHLCALNGGPPKNSTPISNTVPQCEDCI